MKISMMKKVPKLTLKTSRGAEESSFRLLDVINLEAELEMNKNLRCVVNSEDLVTTFQRFSLAKFDFTNLAELYSFHNLVFKFVRRLEVNIIVVVTFFVLHDWKKRVSSHSAITSSVHRHSDVTSLTPRFAK